MPEESSSSVPMILRIFLHYDKLRNKLVMVYKLFLVSYMLVVNLDLCVAIGLLYTCMINNICILTA